MTTARAGLKFPSGVDDQRGCQSKKDDAEKRIGNLRAQLTTFFHPAFQVAQPIHSIAAARQFFKLWIERHVSSMPDMACVRLDGPEDSCLPRLGQQFTRTLFIEKARTTLVVRTLFDA